MSAFDKLVENINRFELIRYPDDYLKRGAILSVTQPHTISEAHGHRMLGLPTYYMSFHDFDKLVSRLFVVCKENPADYWTNLSDNAKSVLCLHNTESHEWLAAPDQLESP